MENFFISENLFIFSWGLASCIFFIFLFYKKILGSQPKIFSPQYDIPQKISPLVAGYLIDRALLPRHINGEILFYQQKNNSLHDQKTKDFFKKKDLVSAQVYLEKSLLEYGFIQRGFSHLSLIILFIILAGLFISGFIYYLVFFPQFIGSETTSLFSLLFLAMIPFFLYAVFVLIRLSGFVLTKKGRNMTKKIQGFKMFLKTMESQKLHALDGEEGLVTPTYIPYIVAFGLETQWHEKIPNFFFKKEWITPDEFSVFSLSSDMHSLFDIVNISVKNIQESGEADS